MFAAFSESEFFNEFNPKKPVFVIKRTRIFLEKKGINSLFVKTLDRRKREREREREREGDATATQTSLTNPFSHGTVNFTVKTANGCGWHSGHC